MIKSIRHIARSGDVILIAYVFLSLLSLIGPYRFLLEGVFFLLALVYLGLRGSLLVGVFCVFNWLVGTNLDGLAAITVVYYFVLIKVIFKRNPGFVPPNLAVLVFCLLLHGGFLVYQNYSDVFRPAGITNSPLAAAYALAAMMLLFAYRRYHFGTAIAAAGMVLPGSRAGAALIVMLSTVNHGLGRGLLLCAVAIFAVLSFFLEFRFASYHATSDSRRLEGWLKVLELDIVENPFGMGRSNLGSVANHIGTTAGTSVESSFLGLIYAYGWAGIIVLSVLLLALFLRNNLGWYIFAALCFVSVIMDSLAVSYVLMMALGLFFSSSKRRIIL